MPYPPYEAVSNDYISYDEILILKDVCDMVEKYYNSSSFEKSAEYLLKEEKSAFEFFYKLSKHYALHTAFAAAQSKKKLYDIFYEYKKNDKRFSSLLLFDFLKNNTGAALPYWAKKNDRYFAKRVSAFIANNRHLLNDNLKDEKLSYILKYIRIYEFDINVLGGLEKRKTAVLFDYKNKCETEVFGIKNLEDENEQTNDR
jgi:hypothetical protein